jgi:hypothetical protein
MLKRISNEVKLITVKNIVIIELALEKRRITLESLIRVSKNGLLFIKV